MSVSLIYDVTIICDYINRLSPIMLHINYEALVSNCYNFFQHYQVGGDGEAVRLQRRAQLRDPFQLDSPRPGRALGGRRAEGGRHGHRPGQDEVLEATLQVSADKSSKYDRTMTIFVEK